MTLKERTISKILLLLCKMLTDNAELRKDLDNIATNIHLYGEKA